MRYKKNVSDIRESPSLKLIADYSRNVARASAITILLSMEIPRTREYASLKGRRSVALDPDMLALYDAVLVSTDHDAVDYGLIAEHARLIVDTRNVFERRGIKSTRVVKA